MTTRGPAPFLFQALTVCWLLFVNPISSFQVSNRQSSWQRRSPMHSAPPTVSPRLCHHDHRLFSAQVTAPENVPENDQDDTNKAVQRQGGSIRSRLRKATGFSLTAFRASMRAFTGISLTAIYVATFTATGGWIRQLTKTVLSIFPPPVRYFLQPFLILYYAPLFILKNLTGPTRKRALKSHEQVVDGWRSAVIKAEEQVSYWPIHVDQETGKFESDGIMELEDGIASSVDVAMDVAMDEQVSALSSPSTSTSSSSTQTNTTAAASTS